MDKKTYEFISQQTKDPIVERRKCKISGEAFPIFQGDLDMLEKLNPIIGGKKYKLPLPIYSPKIRQLIRCTFINLYNLYNDTCDLTGQKTISRFPPESNVTTYTNEAWASDKREYTDYAIDYDGGDPFSYVNKLIKATPYQDLIGSLSNVKNNAVYTNYTADVSNCYLIFDSNRIENSCYTSKSRKSKYVFDCLSIGDSEYCYECVDCKGMYKSNYCYDCSDCNNSSFLIDCHGCNYCIFCTNLNNKEYHIFNEPVSKEEYNHFKNKLIVESYNSDKFPKRQKLQDSMTKKNVNILNSENSIGENIRFSSKIFLSTNIVDSQNLRYCDSIESSQDCMDTDSYGHDSFLMYNSTQVGRYSNHIYFCALLGKCDNLIYCIETKKSKNCFGCVNMKGKEYCIFNKQYTKEQYEKLVPQIIEQMIQSGTWGEFFPSEFSLFPYNDTFSYYLHPIKYILKNGEKILVDSKGEGNIEILESEKFISDAILDLGGEEKLKIKRRNGNKEINIPSCITLIDAQNLPQDIDKIKDDILDKAIVCEVSGRPFRIVKMELDFYRKHKLPIPTKHPDIRHLERMKKRSNNQLVLRNCDKCGIEMLSVYDISNSCKVYCKDCYKYEIF